MQMTQTATAKIVNRAADPTPAAAAKSVQVASTPNVVQLAGAMQVSSPHEPAEREAESTAQRIVRMPAPQPAGEVSGSGVGAMHSPYIARMAGSIIQREPLRPRGQDGQPDVSANLAAEISASQSAGAPLPPSVRSFMEPRFGANFANVKVHANERAASMSRQLNARAFTVGNQIFFGKDRFRPEASEGRELIAHELTHTIQQGAAVQDRTVRRSPDVTISQQSSPQIQRWGLPSPREFFAGKASAIPGFTMLTVVIGFNPITNTPVERSAGNILKGAIELIPGGSFVTQALDNHGIFDKVSTWASQQFESIKSIGSTIWQEIEQFIKDFSITDLGNLGGLWDRAKRIVTRPIDQVMSFAKGLKDGIVGLIKDAILKPIAAFAKTTRGYDLLCAVMGKDPITGEAVPQDAEALIGGFMKFIGEDEVWANMKKANAIPRAFAWFKGAMSAVRGFVNEIPGLFVQAFKSLEVMDIILIPRAFLKLAGVFGNFAGRFVSWAGSAVWNLLEIIFDVVKPGIMGYIKRTGGAIKSILKNPLPFVGNLVKAGMMGFQNFAGNFGGHLKAGLIDWLTGSLPGVSIPKAFSLGEIVKFVFSVLGLTWQNIRVKLVKVVGEPAVKAMETGFDIVVTLVTKGPAAAWEKIKDQLSNLKDMVIGGITDFVVDMVVKKAVPKIVAMFIPGAGFISAILTIYDTIMVFVNKLSKIVQVVTGFIDSIVAIAGGAVAGAAKRVETTLAGLLALAISFLAGFAGLGKVTDKVMGVIQKVRAPIDKALDSLIGWIVTMAKKLFAKVFGKDDKNRPAEGSKEHAEAVKAGLAAISAAEGPLKKDGKLSLKDAQKIAAQVKSAHPIFKSIKAKEHGEKIGYLYKASPELEFLGPPIANGTLNIQTIRIKDPGTAAQVKEAQDTSGNQYELAVQSTVIKEGIVPEWENQLGDPIQIATKGDKSFNRESRQDQPILKVQKGHRDKSGRKRMPDATMEVKAKTVGGPIKEIRVIEVTLVEDFTKGLGNDFSTHKATQIWETLALFKNKYGTTVPVQYNFFCPRAPAPGTVSLIQDSINRLGMANVTVIWNILKTK